MFRLRTRSVFSRRVGDLVERKAGLLVVLLAMASRERRGGLSLVKGWGRRDGWRLRSFIGAKGLREGFDRVDGCVRRVGLEGLGMRVGTARFLSKDICGRREPVLDDRFGHVCGGAGLVDGVIIGSVDAEVNESEASGERFTCGSSCVADSSVDDGICDGVGLVDSVMVVVVSSGVNDGDERLISDSLGISGISVVDRELHFRTRSFKDFFFRRGFTAVSLLTTLPSRTSSPLLSN